MGPLGVPAATVFLPAWSAVAISYPVGRRRSRRSSSIGLGILAWPPQPVAGLIRIEDIALGAAVALVVGLLMWPRGAVGYLRLDWPPLRAGNAYLAAALGSFAGRCTAGLRRAAAACCQRRRTGEPDLRHRTHAAGSGRGPTSLDHRDRRPPTCSSPPVAWSTTSPRRRPPSTRIPTSRQPSPPQGCAARPTGRTSPPPSSPTDSPERPAPTIRCPPRPCHGGEP